MGEQDRQCSACKVSGIRDALLEVRDSTNDPTIKIEAQTLAEEIGSYRFSICSVVWHDILSKIQVNKLLQSESMHMDVAVDLLRKTEASLSEYRSTGFVTAQACARDLCEEMNVIAALKEKRLRVTKRQFSYEAPDEYQTDAMKKMEVTFFNAVVDMTIASLKERTEISDVSNIFHVLTNFPNLPPEEVKKQTKELCNTLTCGDHTDIEEQQLVMELQSFPTWPKPKMTVMELLVFLEEKQLKEIYPNIWVALRIAATIPVTVASAERSFSKLKLIKNYLRSTMSQERLNGLISINQEVSRQLSFDATIDAFAARKSRRVQF
ncbi:zinc finger MYM-type protein 1-like [Thalassophryne amazonica]|uniref:zinc finger MYM-type protein 1-like n=1 Tax=Thalassophryne amazonica TaxID=390379 RepID=UPI0014719E40|nr:zinc finger MYM-type protein 1-like [Thalassophryne amazonica]XP_034044862.1 zinc finger MYM-type protein 1-like [Thalassophryne amazonica]